MIVQFLKRIHRWNQYKKISSSGLFDQEFYRKEYKIDHNEFFHYMEVGWKKGYDPSEMFSTDQYLNAYPDVKKAGINPLYHYYFHGRKEGRTSGVSPLLGIVYETGIPTQESRPLRYSLLKLQIKKSGLFDAAWYERQYGISEKPLQHYLETGYKQGYEPSEDFSGAEYIARYPQVGLAGINPLAHYLCLGKKAGLFYGVDPVKKIRHSKYFDECWYRDAYHIPDSVDAAEHFARKGWKLWYHPSASFSTIQYFLERFHYLHDEKNPLMHYELTHRRNDLPFSEEPLAEGLTKKVLEEYIAVQNKSIVEQYARDTKKLIVYLVPERDSVGGGVMSICSIAQVTASIDETKDFSVMLATVPSVNTFPKCTNFKSSMDVFRFEQIPNYFIELEEIIIHVPEIFVVRFMERLTPNEWLWLQHLKRTRINIMNQNMLYMPRPCIVDILRSNIPDVTITCAHKQYTTAQLRTSYNVPVHLFGASNLVKYSYVPYKKKENLLLYSPDEADFKPYVLKKIQDEFPHLKMKEIRDISYREYLKLIARAKWMITFGEGIDGYFLESVRSGAIPFAVQNPTFFSDAFDNLENVYASYNDMLLHITDDIRRLSKASRFSALNDKLREIDAQEYDDQTYEKNIRKYYRNEYTFPMEPVLKARAARMAAKPLISICMATYNGAKYLKKQLESIAALTYPNIELIVSDDGSTDSTLKLLQDFKPNFPYQILRNSGRHGVVGNFLSAISRARGKYIAMADQDDIWEPRKLEILLDRIDDFDLVHGRVKVIDKYGNLHPMEYMHNTYEADKTCLYRPIHFIEENPILGCTTLMQADFAKRVLSVPSNFIYHDWWFALSAICIGNGVCYVDTPVIKYRQHNNNTAKTTFESKTFVFKKMKTLQLIEQTFKYSMKHYEIKLLQSWVYYYGLTRFSMVYFPAYVNEYYGANRAALTRESLSLFRQTIDGLLEGERHGTRKS